MANATQGGGVQICVPGAPGSPSTSCDQIEPLQQAVAVAVDTDENIFAVNDTGGGADVLLMIPRDINADFGYGDAIPIHSDISSAVFGVTRLTDVMVVPFSAPPFLGRGDVLVLARELGSILRFTKLDIDTKAACGDSCSDPTPTEVVSLAGFEPTGFAFDPQGRFLINTWDGLLLCRTPDDDACDDTFFPLTLPGNGAHIAVGAAEDALGDLVDKMYLAIHNVNGIVQSYNFDTTTGNPIFAAEATDDVSVPFGLGSATTSVAAPTLAGTGIAVSYSGLTTTFEVVNLSGTSFALCKTFDDPRTYTGGSTSDFGVSDELFLCKQGSSENDPSLFDEPDFDESTDCAGAGQFSLDLGIPATIPSFVGGFRRAAVSTELHQFAASGPHSIRICIADTTADFEGVVTDLANESVFLNYLPLCLGPGSPRAVSSLEEPRFHYFPDPLDIVAGDAYPEGDFTTDTSFECDVRGGRKRSILIPGVFDRRAIAPEAALRNVAGVDCSQSTTSIMECKLNSLDGVLDSAVVESCIGRRAERKLQRKLAGVIGKFESGNDCGTIRDLDSFEKTVVDQADEFSCIDQQVDADLRARAKSARLMMCRQAPGCKKCN